jgi:glycosyltransferase involved in cell wall biosynthesis
VPIPRRLESLRVLICIPCLLQGGTERQTLLLARVLVAAGAQVRLLCYFETDRGVMEEFTSAGVRVRALNFSRKLTLPQLLPRLAAEVRQNAPDVVHVQYLAPGLVPILAARLAGCRRVLATVHQPARTYGWKPRVLLRLAARFCTTFLSVSRSVQHSWFGSSLLYEPGSLKPSLPRQATIYNGIDVGRIDKLCAGAQWDDPSTERFSPPGPVVGTVSRLSPEKGIDVLVRALPAMVSAFPDLRLAVVGAGVETENLRRMAAELGVDGRVRWMGAQPWDRCIQLSSLMNVAAYPARFEGFGLGAAEAMACAKPVVASAVDGLREVVGESGAGVLCRVGDHEDLGRQLIGLLRSPSACAKMGASGRARIERNFTVESFRMRMESLYAEVIRGLRPGTRQS